MSSKSPVNGNRNEDLATRNISNRKHELSKALSKVAKIRDQKTAFRIGQNHRKADVCVIGTSRNGKRKTIMLTLKTSMSPGGTACHCGRFVGPAEAARLAGKMTGEDHHALLTALSAVSNVRWADIAANPDKLALVEIGTTSVPARAMARTVVCGPDSDDSTEPELMVVANGSDCWIGPVGSLLKTIPKKGATLIPATKDYASMRLGKLFAAKRDSGNGGTSPDNIQITLLTYEVFKAAQAGELRGWIAARFK